MTCVYNAPHTQRGYAASRARTCEVLRSLTPFPSIGNLLKLFFHSLGFRSPHSMLHLAYLSKLIPICAKNLKLLGLSMAFLGIFNFRPIIRYFFSPLQKLSYYCSLFRSKTQHRVKIATKNTLFL